MIWMTLTSSSSLSARMPHLKGRSCLQKPWHRGRYLLRSWELPKFSRRKGMSLSQSLWWRSERLRAVSTKQPARCRISWRAWKKSCLRWLHTSNMGRARSQSHFFKCARREWTLSWAPPKPSKPSWCRALSGRQTSLTTSDESRTWTELTLTPYWIQSWEGRLLTSDLLHLHFIYTWCNITI